MNPTSSSHPLNNQRIDEEFNLSDIVQFLKDGRHWIVITTIIFAFIGVVYAFLTPPKFEASASIEVASAAGTVVEAPNILVEKLKLPLYYSENTHKACQAENKLPTPGEFISTQLKPLVNKQAPIVTIKFRAESAAQAKLCLESVLSDVKNSQGILSKPILDAKNSHLQLLKRKLDGAEKFLAQLPAGHAKFDFNDPKFSASALLLATSIAKENEVKELRNQINDLQTSLAPPLTREASLVTPIYAPNTKVEPKRAVIILSFAVIGILLGILFWVTRAALRDNGKPQK